MIIKKIETGFCSIRTKRFKKLVALLLLFFSTFLHANTSSIKDAVEQLNYLLDYNQKNVANGESSKNWYVYVLGGNLDNLKYIIDETQNSSITDSFLLNLNKELIELNNGENAVYVALTEYMNPLITPVFDPDIIGEITSLNKMEEYIKGLIDSNDLNLSRADLTKSLSSFSVYKEDFLMKKEALIQTIYQEANLSNQSNGYKNVIMPFSDLSIRQIIQPNGTPPLKKKYYVYSLYIAKVEYKWNKDEFKRLYTQSKNEIKGYGRNGIENKLERMVHTLAHYTFNEEVVSTARNCQELLHDDFYKKDLRPKLLQSGDKVWLDLIENNPCLLNDMYTYQDGLYAEGAEEYEKMLAKFVCYPLYGALAIPAISILGPTAVMEETAKSLIKRYGYKKIQDAGNAIAIDFTMQFTLSYYFDPEVNQLSGTERYTEAFAKTQLDDIASAVLSSMNNFDIPTELVINCLAGGIDADMEVLKNPETFMSNFDFSGCNNNMLGYLFLEVVLGKVSNHAATLTRLKNMVVQNPLSVHRGLKEIIDDASMGELSSKINNQWDDIADNLGVLKESDLYKVFDEFAPAANFSKSIIKSKRGFVNQINSLLKQEGLTMDDFHYMMQKSSNALTTNEKEAINRIRAALPKPNSTSVMQKVIPKGDIEKFLNGTKGTNIKGYVTKAADAKHLETFEDLYYGLRLDYTGTEFFIGDGSCGVIRFTSTNTKSAIIPTGGTYAKYDYPFTAHGFTAGKSERLGAPEWHLTNEIEMFDGAELFEVLSDGSEILRGRIVDKKFVIID